MTDQPQGSAPRYPDLLLAILSAAAAEDGSLGESEIGLIQQIYRSRFRKPVSSEQIREAAAFASRKGGLLALVSAEATQLDAKTKEEIMSAVYLLVLADGQVSEPERGLFRQIAIALGIPDNHFGSILENVATELTKIRATTTSSSDSNRRRW